MLLINQIPESGGLTVEPAEFMVVIESEPGDFTADGLLTLERALTGLVPFVVKSEQELAVKSSDNCLASNRLIVQQQRFRTSAIARVATGLYEGDWTDYVEDPFARYPQSTPPHFDGLNQQFWQARIATFYGSQAAASSVVIDRYSVDDDSYAALIELYDYYKLNAEKGTGYRSIMPFWSGYNPQTDRLIELLGHPRATYSLATDNATDSVFFPNGYSMHPGYRSPENPSDLFIHTFKGIDPYLKRAGVSSVVHRLGWFL